MPQAFEAPCTELGLESQRSHSRDTVASFLVKNSPRALLPCPSRARELRSGRPRRDHDLAGTGYRAEHALDYA